MKNRYIPFGYQIQNGDSVINTEQAATVQHIGVQVNLLFDCPKKGASMKQSSNKKSREATAFLYERLSRDDNLEGESYSIGNQDVICRGWFLPPNTIT